jgi:hypothetical protein
VTNDDPGAWDLYALLRYETGSHGSIWDLKPEAIVHCDGKCTRRLGGMKTTTHGRLIWVDVPSAVLSSDELKAIQDQHGRLKLPAGFKAAFEFVDQEGSRLPDSIVLWCPRHTYRTVSRSAILAGHGKVYASPLVRADDHLPG